MSNDNTDSYQREVSMPPLNRYLITAWIGVINVPVSLGYHKGRTLQDAVDMASKMPFIREVYVNEYSGRQVR